MSWPAYLELHQRGELEQRAKAAERLAGVQRSEDEQFAPVGPAVTIYRSEVFTFSEPLRSAHAIARYDTAVVV